jgi:hypothetical protein
MKSTEGINVEGLEVNVEILKAFKNFKQGSILESNYLHIQHTVSTEAMYHMPEQFDVLERVKREMIQKLSDNLLEKYKDSFEKNETPYGIEFSLSMLTMSGSELKHIVEYCIRTMPQSAIEKIRN